MKTKNNLLSFGLSAFLLLAISCKGNVQETAARTYTQDEPAQEAKIPEKKGIDTARYNSLLQYISNGDSTGKWPVKHDYPLEGAILPYKRIIAYYGNLYSTRMGILGELPKKQMFQKLQGEVDKWNKADSMIPAIPALHYIAVTAQINPGKGGKYRLRMPFHQIDTVVNWAKEINALVFIDIQIGLSSIQEELPEFEKYLMMPNVHFGIDPEFAMKDGARPGTRVGSFDAAEINYAANYLADLVKKHNLPPKILVVHRFTQRMVTNYNKIKLQPEVQVVVEMDGWGEPARKVNTYRQFIYPEPVQFTGFKIFYKNDTEKVGQKREMQPADLLKLTPKPVYVQYQ